MPFCLQTQRTIVVISATFICFAALAGCSKSDSVSVAKSRTLSDTLASTHQLFASLGYTKGKTYAPRDCVTEESYIGTKPWWNAIVRSNICDHGPATLIIQFPRNSETSDLTGGVFKVLYFDDTLAVSAALLKSSTDDFPSFVASSDGACTAKLTRAEIGVVCKLRR